MIELDAIWTPALQQQCYRSLLQAMSYPGQVQRLPASGSENATLAILATLVDAEVSLSDHDCLLDLDAWLLLQAQKSSSDQADFILCRGDLAPALNPRLGTLSSPERSATLIVRVASVNDGNLKLKMAGPGIKGVLQRDLEGLDPAWLSQRQQWISAFPLGVDMLLVDQSSVVGIPRTTQVEVC